MATAQVKLEQLQLQVMNRKCETCGELLAVEYRGEPGRIEEVFYFCINRDKNCPLYHVTQ